MDITTEAVRLGLDLAQVRAEIASSNIARANVPGASLASADFSMATGALQAAVHQDGTVAVLGSIRRETLQAQVHDAGSLADATSLDDQVAEMSTQGVLYRALTDGLSRRFALMQLAITGK